MSKKKRLTDGKSTSKAAKFELIHMAGTRCMLCGKDFGSEITWHHLKPKYAGGDNSIDNASLLCSKCQTRIHRYKWGSVEYMQLTEVILENKQKLTGRRFTFTFT